MRFRTRAPGLGATLGRGFGDGPDDVAAATLATYGIVTAAPTPAPPSFDTQADANTAQTMATYGISTTVAQPALPPLTAGGETGVNIVDYTQAVQAMPAVQAANTQAAQIAANAASNAAAAAAAASAAAAAAVTSAKTTIPVTVTPPPGGAQSQQANAAQTQSIAALNAALAQLQAAQSALGAARDQAGYDAAFARYQVALQIAQGAQAGAAAAGVDVSGLDLSGGDPGALVAGQVMPVAPNAAGIGGSGSKLALFAALALGAVVLLK